ncbi:MAG: preprotein translocase subunit SecE [Acetobacteraceae bacterium]|nr:preprotein translocase subunit SecE [Acetobacteraceae bacterium]
MAVHPARFLREVRTEIGRVTWPSRRETLVTTGLVVGMVALAAAFFFAIDEAVSIAVRAMFGAAS